MSERVVEQLLTAEAVGKMLSLSKRTIFRLDSSGRIPAPVRISGSVRWVESHIQKWIYLGCPERTVFEAKANVEKY